METCKITHSSANAIMQAHTLEEVFSRLKMSFLKFKYVKELRNRILNGIILNNKTLRLEDALNEADAHRRFAFGKIAG